MVAYLWSSNVLPGVPDTTGLLSTNRVDTFVPGPFDEVLQLKNTWCTARELLVALRMCALDVRGKHLYVAIAAEAAFPGRLANVNS